ncbi:hypothetical protein HK104_010754 [Borealophlyctis nickersoniae]|nr:hypothetical protein HK104_010754 [Borealophlyctis nickersoniae]
MLRPTFFFVLLISLLCFQEVHSKKLDAKTPPFTTVESDREVTVSLTIYDDLKEVVSVEAYNDGVLVKVQPTTCPTDPCPPIALHIPLPHTTLSTSTATHTYNATTHTITVIIPKLIPAPLFDPNHAAAAEGAEVLSKDAGKVVLRIPGLVDGDDLGEGGEEDEVREEKVRRMEEEVRERVRKVERQVYHRNGEDGGLKKREEAVGADEKGGGYLADLKTKVEEKVVRGIKDVSCFWAGMEGVLRNLCDRLIV